MILTFLAAAAMASTIAVEPGSFVLQEKGWAPIEITGITLPPFSAGEEGSCRVVLGLPLDGGITAEVGRCDSTLAYRCEQATLDWTAVAHHRDFYEQEASLGIEYVFTGSAVRLYFEETYLRSPVAARPRFVDTASFELARTVVPRYPKELLGSGEGASCVVRAQVQPNGRPRDLEVVDCPEPFVDSAVKAIKKWRWEPPRSNGERVTQATRVSVSFQPMDPPGPKKPRGKEPQ